MIRILLLTCLMLGGCKAFDKKIIRNSQLMPPIIRKQSLAQPEVVIQLSYPEVLFVYTNTIPDGMWKLQYTEDLMTFQDAIEAQDYDNLVDDVGTHIIVHATNNMRFYRVTGL